jgi:hypothetical protein
MPDCSREWDGIENALSYGVRPPLGGFKFVPRVHNGVRLGLKGIDESLFPIIALKY